MVPNPPPNRPQEQTAPRNRRASRLLCRAGPACRSASHSSFLAFTEEAQRSENKNSPALRGRKTRGLLLFFSNIPTVISDSNAYQSAELSPCRPRGLCLCCLKLPKAETVSASFPTWLRVSQLESLTKAKEAEAAAAPGPAPLSPTCPAEPRRDLVTLQGEHNTPQSPPAPCALRPAPTGRRWREAGKPLVGARGLNRSDTTEGSTAGPPSDLPLALDQERKALPQLSKPCAASRPRSTAHRGQEAAGGAVAEPSWEVSSCAGTPGRGLPPLTPAPCIQAGFASPPPSTRRTEGEAFSLFLFLLLTFTHGCPLDPKLCVCFPFPRAVSLPFSIYSP